MNISRSIHFADDNATAQIEALKTDITVALAGLAAQMKLRPAKRNFQGCDDDLNTADAWASWAAFLASGVPNVAELNAEGKIELTEKEQAFADNLIAQCEEAAHRIVDERWADIEKIADALLDRAVLNADDLDTILKPESAGLP